MKLIAIDSSGLVASVAIVEDDILVGEYNVQYKKTHSQTLLPMLDALKKMVDLDLKTVDAIALSKGPGSFTGLRIGSATAKGLGLAMKVPLVEIPTLDGLACNLYGVTDKLICPIMDARRNQVYTGIYEYHREEVPISYKLTAVREQCAISIEELQCAWPRGFVFGGWSSGLCRGACKAAKDPLWICTGAHEQTEGSSLCQSGSQVFKGRKLCGSRKACP